MINRKFLEGVLTECEGKIVAVIGDVMLDRYFWGKVSRVSPEAPVPVVDFDNETNHLGGAANVAQNLRSLGINPILCGMIGEDDSAKIFINLALENKISTEGLYKDPERPTTVKTRLIGNNQHIARLDNESRKPANGKGIKHILSTLENTDNLAAIIFEDYNKGVITKELLDTIIDFAINKNIPIFVDPKFNNFFEYKGVTLFKPNKKEASQALNMEINTLDDVREAADKLLNILNCRYVLITLSAEGMMLIEKDKDPLHIHANARRVADVSGAGDTAIAALVASYLGGADMQQAAMIANYASGVVVTEPGIVAIEKEKLFDAII